ncbi:TIGR02452 family protein [Paenibacillus sp. 28ISP30-2]|nr:TIGR02452 family protein [Paenibacillus sp. 28ISP30-2]
MKHTMDTRSNRDIRSHMAQETLSILENGYYTNTKQAQVNIAQEVSNAITGSKLYAPSQLVAVKQEAEEKILLSKGALESSRLTQQTIHEKMEVTGESTLEAAYRLQVSEKLEHVACLNFASAKNPGGGFLGGSQGWEGPTLEPRPVSGTPIAPFALKNNTQIKMEDNSDIHHEARK